MANAVVTTMRGLFGGDNRPNPAKFKEGVVELSPNLKDKETITDSYKLAYESGGVHVLVEYPELYYVQ